MLATREEAGVYIQAMKAALDRRCVLRDRPKNSQRLAELGWKYDEVKDVIAGLALEDYSQGPLTDERGLGEELWVFGPYVEGRQLYVKVAIVEWGLKVHSFHPAEHPLPLPLK